MSVFVRIAVRSDGDLVIGINKELLRPGHVYEITSPMTWPGEAADTADMLIRDLGVSIATYRDDMHADKTFPNDITGTSYASWSRTANDLATDGDHLWTVDEIAKRLDTIEGVDPMQTLLLLESYRARNR